VFEAAGGDVMKPKEPGPDPTGILPLHQAWELGSTVGGVVTCGVGHPSGSTIGFPATQWANGRTTQYPGKGTNLKRDLPRYVRLMETKQFDAKSLVTTKYPLDRIHDAYRAVGERTVVTAIIAFA
jgi:Zn-dependent alcohol dehydrogenase